jgi:succinate dehydrogenase / fumarate reductase cytochrome b subunit
MLSILHRMTGVGLVGSALIFTYWISSATYGPEAFDMAQSILGSWFGRLVLLAVIFAFYFHLANGIRHLAWDAGWGYEMPTLRASGVVVLVFSTSMTILTFLAGYWAAGVI